MHEMSLAQNILEVSKQYIPEGYNAIIKTINIKIGNAAGVVSESLVFCFNAMKDETIFKETELLIEEVPLKLYCNRCTKAGIRDDLIFCCVECGSSDVTVLAGRELEISTIDITEPPETQT